MKNITQKIIALLASAVTAITTLSVSYSEAFAETPQDSSTSSDDTEYEVNTGGLLGNLMTDEFKKLKKENEEAQNSDYAVYRLDFDEAKENLIVSYSAKDDCTLFVGFYNDEGTQLYTSLTKTLSAGVEQYDVLSIPELQSKYYTVKAFMVGGFNEPLTPPCENRERTKEIQEIIDKTTDNFDDNKIIRFSDDDEYNFIVAKNEFKTIESSETKDTISDEDDENNTVTFTNIDKVKDIKEGQDVFVKANDNILFFRVDKININDNKAVVTRENIEFSEMVDYIKFDYSKYKGEVKASIKNCDDELVSDCYVIDGKETSDGSDSDNKRKQLSPVALLLLNGDHTISQKFHYDLKEFANTNETAIATGYVEFGIDIQLKIYYYDDIFSMTGSFKKSLTLKSEFKLEGEIKLGEASVWFPPFSISIIPKIKISLTGNIFYTYSVKYDFDIDPFGASKIVEHDPENEISKDATLELSFGLDIGVNFVDDHVLRISIEPEVGVSLTLEDSDVDENEYIRHDCSDCVSISLGVFFRISIHFKIFGKELLGSELFKKVVENSSAEGEYDLKIKQWHFRNGVLYDGPCDNTSHKIIIHVKEKETDSFGKDILTPISGATAYSGKYVSSDEMFLDENDKEIISNENGDIELWIKDKLLSDENYCIIVKAPDNKIATVHVGKRWNSGSKGPNEYGAIIDSRSTSIDPDDEISYPITGNCGVGRPSIIDPTELTYDNVTYSYWSSGECDVWGYGTVDGSKLSKELEKKGINTVKRLQIGNNVKLTDDNSTVAIGFSSLKIEEVEFLGNNGKVFPLIFNGRSELKRVTLSDFEIIKDHAFQYCTGLENIDFGSCSVKEIESAAFEGCKKLENISLPDSVEKIGDYAFRGSGLQKIVMPNNLKEIGYDAFRSCNALKNVIFNERIETIKNLAFEQSGITRINIPASVKMIGSEAFGSCKNLKTVIINGDFETENSQPFYLSPVETLIMNNGVKKISASLFRSSSDLKRVRFSKNLTSIGYWAFGGTGLTNINLPDSLETIGEGAFQNSKLTSVTIPQNVTQICKGAFVCDTITDITILNPNCLLGKDKEDEESKEVVLPKTTVWGYTGSTAKAYAKENGNTFKALDTPAVTTATVVTTTVTTTTAVVTTQVAPDAECVFIAVKDEKTADSPANKVFANDNVKFFDQQTANYDGVVSFSYLPDEKEKWAFIFVSEAINDTITKTFGTPDDLKTTTYNAAPGVKGDANGDGEIDMSDVVLIMQALANPNKYGVDGTDPKHITESGFKYADSDGDGLTVNDALRIQQYLLGLIPSLS